MIEKVCESSKFKDKSYSYLQPGSCVPRLSTQATVWGKSTENPLRMKDRLKPDSEEYMRAIKNTSTYTAEGRWCKPVAARAAAATWPTSCERALVELGESSVGDLHLLCVTSVSDYLFRFLSNSVVFPSKLISNIIHQFAAALLE